MFRKKKNKTPGGDGYPKQQSGYPRQQSGYPVQQPYQYPGQYPPGSYPPGQYPQGPYTPGQYPPPQQTNYPPLPQSNEQPPPYSQAPPPQQRPVQPVPLPVAVFDQTATIDPNKPLNIPPPPPGYLPTAAQHAYSQGSSVQVTQQKKDFWGGGSDGGYTLF